MLAFVFLAATINVHPPTLTTHHVMRSGEEHVFCTGADPDEVEAVELRNREHEGLSYVVDSYRDRNISVSFSGSFPQEAEKAFLAAAGIWDSLLEIRVPIWIGALPPAMSRRDPGRNRGVSGAGVFLPPLPHPVVPVPVGMKESA